MQTVTVSPKFQVVIPKSVRETLHLRPGQKMQVVEYEGRPNQKIYILEIDHYAFIVPFIEKDDEIFLA